MPWPPKIGDSLPRSADAWFEQPKLDWILGTKGHGEEWSRVFRIYPDDRELVLETFAETARESLIAEVRDRSPFGIVCEQQPKLTLNGRSAFLVLSWHYPFEGAAPRLVTAYPTT